MSNISTQENLALLKFGLNLPLAQREEALKIIKSNTIYKDDFQNIKNNLRTMTDENEFLSLIIASHQGICDVPDNCKVIQLRDKTFQIRAINPEHISSLTERAFFNSFNLQRIVPNDLEEEENYNRESQKNIKVQEYRKEKETVKQQRIPEEGVDNFKKINQIDEEAKCICGNVNAKDEWVQCSRESKCRGSNWYHMDCSGIELKKIEDIANEDFLCCLCKRAEQEESSGQKSLKRVKKNQS